MISISSLEESKVVDKRTGLDIKVSTTVRKIFRKAFPDKFLDMRNARLNYYISEDFSSNSSNVVHFFKLGKNGELAEIRKGSGGIYYISAIRKNTIDILVIQSDWIKPKFKSKPLNTDNFGRIITW